MKTRPYPPSDSARLSFEADLRVQALEIIRIEPYDYPEPVCPDCEQNDEVRLDWQRDWRWTCAHCDARWDP